VDPAAIANVFAQLDRELWLVTAAAGNRRGGLIATFVNQASIVPEMPRVVVGLAHQHHTWGLVEAAGAFALHLLAEDQLDRVWRFGLESGRDGDKLAGLPLRVGVTGAPLLTDAPAFLECRVEARWDSGDRTLYLAGVVDGAVAQAGPVLTMRRAAVGPTGPAAAAQGRAGARRGGRCGGHSAVAGAAGRSVGRWG
jgi:flavin reductase (DIM6/NTAB) family NADH-FMN oxidoreductase RutF